MVINHLQNGMILQMAVHNGRIPGRIMKDRIADSLSILLSICPRNGAVFGVGIKLKIRQFSHDTYCGLWMNVE